MSLPIAPLKEADLPKREKSFWRMTGPGAVMVGMAIGSGELVLWPWITAKFGADMVWAAALGVFVQMWINIEIGRWAISTGESAFTGFARISKLTVYYFMALLLIGALLPGWARATGTAFKMLFFGVDGPGADWVWTALVFMVIFAVLFGPKRVYATIERAVSVMVVVIVLGMLVVAFKVGTFSDVAAMGKGLINFGDIQLDDDFTALRFFGAFVFAGAGGFGNLFYAYYLRDKGIGMGGRVPVLTSALREKAEDDTDIGFVFRDTDENRIRFRDWMNYVKLDSSLYFWLLNTLTMFLFMFGALVVLHPLNAVPAEDQIIWDLSQILESTMGTWGRYLFLIIAMAAMFSTQLTASDGSYRLWTDLLHNNFRFAKRFTVNQWYLYLAITLMSVGVLSTWFFDTIDVSVLDFFFLNAVMNGFAMAAYTPLLLILCWKYLPKSARPHPINIVMVSIGAAIYIGFAVYTVWDKVSAWLA